MKRLKIALLTLLLPILAFAAVDPFSGLRYWAPYSSEDMNSTDIFKIVKGFSGKYEFYNAESDDTEYCDWEIENKPDWINNIYNKRLWGFTMTITGAPTSLESTTRFKIKAEACEGGVHEKEYSIRLIDMDIVYCPGFHCNDYGEFSNVTNLSFIKGKKYAYTFMPNSNLLGEWEVTDLPDWLIALDPSRSEIDPNGEYRGITVTVNTVDGKVPTNAASSTGFTLKVKDRKDNIKEQTYPIIIETPAFPAISTPNNEPLITGEVYKGVYRYLETASSYVEWSIESGDLPPGFYLSSGFIGGYPTTAGTYSFTVKAENVSGRATKEFSIVVTEPTAKPDFEGIGTYYSGRWQEGPEHTLPEGFIDVTFNLNHFGNVTVSQGALPPGIELTREEGLNYRLSGNILFNESANEYYFNLKAENAHGDSEKEFKFTITPATKKPSIWSSEGCSLYANKEPKCSPYSFYKESSVGASWSATGLPPGTRIESYENYSEIHGTPTTPGTYIVKVKAENSRGSDEKAVVIIVKPASPVIAISSLPDAKVGTSYYQYIGDMDDAEIVGDVDVPFDAVCWLNEGCFIYSYDLGARDIKTYTFKLIAYGYGDATAERQLSIRVVAPAKPTFATSSLPNGKVGREYSQKIEVSDATDLYNGDYRDDDCGLGVNGISEDGVWTYSIVGTPSVAGTCTINLVASNYSGETSKSFTIRISEDNVAPNTIKTAVLPDVVVHRDYEKTFEITNDANVYDYEIEGVLPGYLSIWCYGGYCKIMGYVREDGMGEHSFKLKLCNEYGCTTEKTFTLNVREPKAPTIATALLPAGTVNKPYSTTLNGTEYPNWVVYKGSLPSGLWLNSETGVISGTPITTGTSSFTLVAWNDVWYAEKPLSITINGSGSGNGGGTIDPPISSCPTGAVCGIGVSPPPATTPVISQLDVSKLSVRATSSAIVLEKLPSNAKVEVYNLQGKRIYSANSANSQTLQIQVPKGMYVVKAANQTLRAVVK